MARRSRRLAADGEGRARPKLKPLSVLFPYLLRYPWLTAGTAVALVVAALTTLALPLAVRRMIDHGFSDSDAGFVDAYFSMLLVLAFVLAAASASRYFFVTVLGERVVADLRRDLFAHLLTLSPAFFDRTRSGEIVSRLTADMTQVKSAVGTTASAALRNFLLFVGATIMMVVTSPGLSGLVLAVIPLIVLPIVGFGRRVRRASARAQGEVAAASAYATEVLGAVRTVQSFTGERAAAARFGGLVEGAFRAARGATLARALLTGCAIFLVFASVVAVLWWGAQAVLADTMTGGRLGQFVLYAVFAAGAFGELSQVWGEVSLAAGSTERIADLMAERPLIAAPPDPKPLPEPARGEIRFESVSFAYREDVPSLHGVSFTVAPGERVAIVGPSGAGKTTLFALLMRFYDVTAGRILVDGIDIREVDPRALRARIALVPQEPIVFAASAAENIAFGTEGADEAAIRAAARAAHAEGFIEDLPEETFVATVRWRSSRPSR